MLKETVVPLKGNDQYEGFGIEMIERLADRLGFNYIFQIQKGSSYGSYNVTTEEWDGMIRQLMDDEADLAITDLTITAERERGADFTMVNSDDWSTQKGVICKLSCSLETNWRQIIALKRENRADFSHPSMNLSGADFTMNLFIFISSPS